MLKPKKIVFSLAAATLLAALSLAEIYNMRPFGTGLFSALLMFDVPVWLTAPVYLVTNAAFCTAPAQVWGYAAVCVCAVTLKAVTAAIKTKPPLWSVLLSGAVGNCGFIYAAVIKVITPLSLIVGTLFSLILAVVYITAVKPFFRKGTPITELTRAAMCCMLGSVALAANAEIGGAFTFVYALGAAATLFVMKTGGLGAGFAVALCVGIGISLGDFSPSGAAVSACAALIAAIFIGGHRTLAAAGYLLAFTAALCLFGGADLFDVLSAFIGCALYAAVPTKKIMRFSSEKRSAAHERALLRLMERERVGTGGEINCAAEIFGQMSRITALVSAGAPDTQHYAQRLLDEVCAACPYRGGCNVSGLDVMRSLVERALEDGHTSVGGLPESIVDGCRSAGALIAKTNAFGEKNKCDEAVAKARVAAADLVCAQLGGAEGVMRAFGQRMTDRARFDFDGARKIKEELVFGGCDCQSALVRKERGGMINVSLNVESQAFDKRKTEKILSKIYKRPFFFVSSSADEGGSAGYENAVFKSDTVYDVVFGVSSLAKDSSGKSGDTYSFSRIGADGFVMAISDGMGSGEDAERVSVRAVSLVENYYKAGFSSDFILASVNRFLSMSKEETFAAMDILVLDLSAACGDVIKVACPATLVKRDGEVAALSGSALPLGAVEEITPFAESVAFKEGDMIVMMSDGAADAFADGEAAALIAKNDTLNPQKLSRAVLDAALANTGGQRLDDMTVVCGRIYRRA